MGERTNRRHKPGRAFERTGYRFDVLADYGAFRDLQRHRMLTIEWQALTPKHGYEVPDSVAEAGETPAFVQAMDRWPRCTVRWHFAFLNKRRTRWRSATGCGSSCR